MRPEPARPAATAGWAGRPSVAAVAAAGGAGGGGGAGDVNRYPRASGGSGSAYKSGTFTANLTVGAADSTNDPGRTAVTSTYTGPGRCGNGTSAGNNGIGGAGTAGQVKITLL